MAPGSVAHAEQGSALPRLERYEVLDVIASGGMGTVYRARSRADGALRALKCPKADHPKARKLARAFEREYRVLKTLAHPRIIRVYEYGHMDDGQPYYCMELLSGDDLRGVGPLPWKQACQYLRDVAACLSLLHARRLVHRDITPGNVKLTGDGHCKVLDFGALVDFGNTDNIVGTPAFVAPEVVEVGRLDQRVDLYSLGTLGYYCLTGKVPYPARKLDDLPEVWKSTPKSLAADNPSVPTRLSDLIMDLIRKDPLARPSSAAEVVSRLDEIGELPPEDRDSRRALAQSFFEHPQYVGSTRPLETGVDLVRTAKEGHGGATMVSGSPGSGKSRLLDEVELRAQLEGVVVVRADAAACEGRYGVVSTLARGLLDAVPSAAQQGLAHFSAFENLGDEHCLRVLSGDHARSEESTSSGGAKPPESSRAPRSGAIARDESPRGGVEHWFLRVSHELPLLLLVDNVECADDASVGSLSQLADAAPLHPLALFLANRETDTQNETFGLRGLRHACNEVTLHPLSQGETERLVRHVLGDAPRMVRLVKWLHAAAGGIPLHVLGALRTLVASGAIGYENGAWVLPSSRPPLLETTVLGDTLRRTLDALPSEALALAQCLSLAGVDLTDELCQAIVAQEEDFPASLLEQLEAHSILHRASHRYRFTGEALRTEIKATLDPSASRLAHVRLGRAMATLPEAKEPQHKLTIGLHLIKGGDEVRGADMIAAVARSCIQCNILASHLYEVGSAAEAALKVYRRARRTRRERMPLLTMLGQAGYYEHYRWIETYGDEALDLIDEMSGMALARRLRPYLGGLLAIGIALLVASVRHYLTPRRAGCGSFHNVLIHLCSTVTTASGVAALSLDGDRCDRVAKVISPVRVLPSRLAIVGIYEFCRGLQHVAREHQAQAFERFDELARRFEDPHYYWLLPRLTRYVYSSGCHFARGAFGLMRARGQAALESAHKLEQSGLPLYAMIADQIRRLYHLNRGELDEAARYQRSVEVHAARVGSAWQVEYWEPASLIPLHLATRNVVELRRIAHRASEVASHVPSMWRYRELALLAARVCASSSDRHINKAFWKMTCDVPPRSYIGWSTAMAGASLFLRENGDLHRAWTYLDEAASRMTDADREYVMIFLLVDHQTALAEAALGRTEAAFARLDHLLGLLQGSDHALALGLTHATRAQIAWGAGLRDDYRRCLDRAGEWLRGTGVPSLIAICERLEALDAQGDSKQPASTRYAKPHLPATSTLASRRGSQA